MKPLKIILSAFGTFADKTSVSFEDFGKDSVFLITGDTGSGKTTLFDAICFALYGKASGDIRDVRQFRSQYAKPENETYVILEFLCRERKYRVKRNPLFERAKKNGTGTTIQKPDAELFDITDSENSFIIKNGYNDVTEKVTEILGIDEQQFRQIVMIAQGQFQKFLFSSSTEKEKILRQLFHTNSCENIQKILSERLSSLKESNKSDEEYILYTLNQISPNEEDYAKIYFEILSSNGVGTSLKLCDILETTCKNTENQIPDIEEDINKFQKSTDSIIKEIENGKKHNENIIELEKNLDILKKAEKEFSDSQNKLKKAEEDSKILPELTKQLNIIENKLSEYQNLDDIQKKHKELEKNLYDLSDKCKKSQDNLEKKQNEFNEISQYLESKGNTELELTELFYKREKNKEKINDFQKIQDHFNILKSENELLNKISDEYKNAHQNYFNNIKLQYDKTEYLFFKNMAGTLALKLENGEKCPVCGSKEHPAPALINEEPISEQDFHDIQKKHNNALQNLNDLKNNFEKQNERVKLLETNYKEMLSKNELAEDTDIKSLQKIVNELNIYFEDLNEKIKDLEKEIQQDNQKRELINKHKELIPDIKSECDELCKRKHQIENMLEQNLNEISRITSQLPYKTLNEAKIKIKSLENQIETLESQKKEAENVLNLKKEKITKLKSIINHLKNKIKNKPAYDIEHSENILNNKRKELQILQEKLISMQNYCNNCYKIISNVREKFSLLEDSQKTQMLYNKLHSMITGNHAGTEKISFERFVQTYYFNQVIDHANKKLLMLSNGRYCLVRRQQEQKHNFSSGLNLDVLDYYTGKLRNAETLSGGETFLTSLSLALGLSDTVQSYSGGIQLDAMFIDEGFGSLDSNTLENAVCLLEQLSDNRQMIGIISHISELSERFENKITILKENNGSKIKCVFKKD